MLSLSLAEGVTAFYNRFYFFLLWERHFLRLRENFVVPILKDAERQKRSTVHRLPTGC